MQIIAFIMSEIHCYYFKDSEIGTQSRITTTVDHSLLPIFAPSFVNKRQSWCCVSCSFLVEESNSAPAIAGATNHGSGAALNVGSRFLTIPGIPGKPLFCARFYYSLHIH